MNPPTQVMTRANRGCQTPEQQTLTHPKHATPASRESRSSEYPEELTVEVKRTILDADTLTGFGPIVKVLMPDSQSNKQPILVLCKCGLIVLDLLTQKIKWKFPFASERNRDLQLIKDYYLVFGVGEPVHLINILDLEGDVQLLASSEARFRGKILSGAWNACATSTQVQHGLAYFLVSPDPDLLISKSPNMLAVIKPIQKPCGTYTLAEGIFNISDVEDFSVQGQNSSLYCLSSQGRVERYSICITDVEIVSMQQETKFQLETFSSCESFYNLKVHHLGQRFWSKLLVTSQQILVAGWNSSQRLTCFYLFRKEQLKLCACAEDISPTGVPTTPVTQLSEIYISPGNLCFLAAHTSGHISVLCSPKDLLSLSIIGSKFVTPSAGNLFFGVSRSVCNSESATAGNIYVWGAEFLKELRLATDH